MTRGRGPLWRRLLAAVAWLLLLLLVAAGCLLWYEMTTSRLQARYLTGLAAEIGYRVEPGPSDAIRFPSHGPFDLRHGYVGLPQWTERLAERGYSIAAQARISPRMAEVVDFGLFAPHREKIQVGLAVADCAGETIFDVRYPERVYPDFESVPPVLVDTLLFIENRELLSNRFPTKNPAVEWDRFLRAAFDQALRRIRPEHEAAGGSTLATQIEKYRHSPEGRTTSGEEKLRQMASASVRAYLDGPDTTAVRRRLVVDYLNTVPLAAARGYGEVTGLGDGMWVWYGREFDDLNRLLSDGSSPPEERALAYKQALSLMISQRRPTGYLAGDPAELERLTDVFLGLLADAGVVSPALRDVARAQPLARRAGGIAAPRISFVNRKAVSAVRGQVAGLLGLGALYELDRLDLAVSTTLDTRLQQAVTERLQSLADPKVAAAAGLTAERLLADSDPAGVLYSFTLFERVGGANVVRVQADTLDQPFDVNEGTRLDLGSTAKLRTLVTYLEIVARLHGRLEPLSPQELDAVPVASRDAIGRWAVDYLRGATGEARSLAAMLEAAMERRYPASPAETFFTGGGAMTFGNFDSADDGRSPTVREGMQRSVNLLFIRLMRDIVRHTISELPSSSATLLDDESDPRRREYLERFADREGREFLARFHRKYAGRSPEEAQALLLAGMRPTPRRLAAVFRVLEPEAGVEEFAAFLRASLPDAAVPDSVLPRLYADHAIGRYDLSDRGYIAGVHPLELWLVSYLRTHPGASLREVIEASGEQRQDVYGWLFKTRRKGAQDARIRSMVELEAFEEIHRSWQRLGYPFQSLTPSYATALGSSADRPASLAELVGILLNDGRRLPTLRVDALRFAAGTPYGTAFVASPPAGERVLPPEVARTALRALAGVVESGTARRLAGTFTDADGRPLVVGGKTGTGDHRFETYGRGGVLLSSRVVSRSGTFVFFLGERHFGTITAYVKGPEAARYRFTSALPTQVLKTLAPLLAPELRREPRVGTSCAADAPVRALPPSILGEPPLTPVGAGGPAGEALDTAAGPATDLPDVASPEADVPTD